MRRPTATLALVALGALAAACGRSDERARADSAATAAARADSTPAGGKVVERPSQPGDMTIVTEDGSISLALAGDSVSMRLADSLLNSMRRGLEQKSAEHKTKGGIGGQIASMVQSTAARALGQQITYKLADIEDVRVENGALRFRYRNRHALSFEDVDANKRKALESFRPADAERFAAAVRARKGT